MEEWKECRLGDILNFRRGYDLPKTKMVSGKIPVAGSNGIIGYHNEATPITTMYNNRQEW
jgi:type I restriction enzyme S subunit